MSRPQSSQCNDCSLLLLPSSSTTTTNSAVGAFDWLQLTCPVVTIAAQILIRGPPDFDTIAGDETPFFLDPGTQSIVKISERIIRFVQGGPNSATVARG